jgi:hypothetical protein
MITATVHFGSEPEVYRIFLGRLLPDGDLNRSMQHLDSKYREEDVADEVQNADLLQRRAEKLDVGSLAGW